MSSSHRPPSDEQHIAYKRYVKFSCKTKVSFIPGLNEISDEEIDAMWFTEKECVKIQVSMVKTVKRMRKGNMDEEKYCSRGLEHMRTADDAEQRKANKDAVCKAVLDEHRRQRLLGYYDPMEICRVSSLHSKGSRDEALRMGESDAAAAQQSRPRSEISQETNKSCHESQSSIVPQSITHEEYLSRIGSALKVADSTQRNGVYVKEGVCSEAEGSCLSKKQTISRNTFARVMSKINLRLDVECAC